MNYQRKSYIKHELSEIYHELKNEKSLNLYRDLEQRASIFAS